MPTPLLPTSYCDEHEQHRWTYVHSPLNPESSGRERPLVSRPGFHLVELALANDLIWGCHFISSHLNFFHVWTIEFELNDLWGSCTTFLALILIIFFHFNNYFSNKVKVDAKVLSSEVMLNQILTVQKPSWLMWWVKLHRNLPTAWSLTGIIIRITYLKNHIHCS